MLNFDIFSSNISLGRAVATEIVADATVAVAQQGHFTVAFSGGSLPALVCPPLVTEFADQIDWSAWYVFFADERWVPPDHPESNYRLLCEQLLDQVPIPPAQIYLMDEGLAPAAAAAEYAKKLVTCFGATRLPRFDLVLLGMGPDGHTASLFPNHAVLAEIDQWVAPIWNAPKPPPQRITFTLPVLNQARRVSFVVTGGGKAAAVAAVLTKPPSAARPASLVRPQNGHVHWFLDSEAGVTLPTGLEHLEITT
jgi:6-phosphogluconolactonase